MSLILSQLADHVRLLAESLECNVLEIIGSLVDGGLLTSEQADELRRYIDDYNT